MRTKNLNINHPFLLAAIILLEFALIGYYILARQIPGGHDGFFYLIDQYYFLNNAVISGEMTQWIPFMTHGVSASYPYIKQAGILQNTLCLVAPFLKGFNFLGLFYFGIFVQILILITGLWLFTAKLYSSNYTKYFVIISIVGSCIWVYEPYFNLHLYYALPLILFFFHSFIDTGQWRYCLLAGNLLAIQILGNSAYFFPLITLVIFLYFLYYFLFNFKDTIKKIKAIRFHQYSFISLILILLSFIIVYSAIIPGREQMAFYAPDRNPNGTVNLQTFLTYGFDSSFNKLSELILGISWNFDSTFYIGFVALCLTIFGITFNTNRKTAHILCLIITLILLSEGTFVSSLAFHVWPYMKYFRHLSNINILTKIFLCFTAGLGFEYLFIRKHKSKQSRLTRDTMIFVSAFMFLTALSQFNSAHNSDILQSFEKTGQFDAVLSKNPFQEASLKHWLYLSSLFAFSTALLFGLKVFLNAKISKRSFLILALSIHTLNIYAYKIHTTQLRMIALPQNEYNLFNFQNIPFSHKRQASLWDNNPRASILTLLSLKDYNNFVNAFTFHDEIGHSARANYSLRPFDQYMRIYWRQPINDSSVQTKGAIFKQLVFPATHPAATKISGLNEAKIQFFAKAAMIDQEEKIAEYMVHKNYRGNSLFISSAPSEQITKQSPSLSSNDRLNIPYKITRFDSNTLNVAVTTPQEGVWMLYSDVWDPDWQATINGQITPIAKANLAYKAVPLKKGLNQIHLRYRPPHLAFLQTVINVNSLLWVILIIGLVGRLCFNRKKDLFSI